MKIPDLNSFKKFYSAPDLWRKLTRMAGNKAIQICYSACLLYFAYQKKETPIWAKNIMLGTLGYLINPIDLLPDLTPILGYTDDLGVISFGIMTVICFIDQEIKDKSKVKIKNLFSIEDDFIFQKLDKAL